MARAVQAATPPDTTPSAPASPTTAQGPTPEVLKEVFRNGEAGFVVTEIAYALGSDAKDSGACPAGMTAGVRGLIEAEWGLSEHNRRARFYRLTSAGRRALQREVASWERYVRLVARVLGTRAGTA